MRGLWSFDIDDTWTWPGGQTEALVICRAAGAPGGTSTSGEGGGGAGGYSEAIVTKTETTANIEVGNGGTQSGANNDSSFEQDTTVNVLAKGGTAASTRTGGAGGLASSGIGTIKFSGGDGGTSAGGSPVGGAGGGGAATVSGDGQDGQPNDGEDGGAGGLGPTGRTSGGAGGGQSVNGGNAVLIGGGGGGGGGGGSIASRGLGKAGQVIVICPPEGREGVRFGAGECCNVGGVFFPRPSWFVVSEQDEELPCWHSSTLFSGGNIHSPIGIHETSGDLGDATILHVINKNYFGSAGVPGYHNKIIQYDIHGCSQLSSHTFGVTDFPSVDGPNSSGVVQTWAATSGSFSFRGIEYDPWEHIYRGVFILRSGPSDDGVAIPCTIDPDTFAVTTYGPVVLGGSYDPWPSGTHYARSGGNGGLVFSPAEVDGLAYDVVFSEGGYQYARKSNNGSFVENVLLRDGVEISTPSVALSYLAKGGESGPYIGSSTLAYLVDPASGSTSTISGHTTNFNLFWFSRYEGVWWNAAVIGGPTRVLKKFILNGTSMIGITDHTLRQFDAASSDSVARNRFVGIPILDI